MGCCGQRKCGWSCAWKVWSELAKRRSSSMEFVFVQNGTDPKNTGKMAFLGRWKSNTVLIYAEEALEEIPANQRLLPGTTRLSCWKAPKRLRGRADMGDDVPIPMTPHSTSPSCLPLPPTPSKVVDEQQGSKDAAIVSCLTFDRPRELWVYSIRDNRKDPTLHLVAAAGWEMPMSEWKTGPETRPRRPFLTRVTSQERNAESAFSTKVNATVSVRLTLGVYVLAPLLALLCRTACVQHQNMKLRHRL